MSCLPFCPPFPTLPPLSSRFPLSLLGPCSPDTLPSGLPPHQQRDALVAANKPVIVQELRDPSAWHLPSMPEGAGPPRHHAPTSAPQSCAQEMLPGDFGLCQFCFVLKKQTKNS